MNQQAKDHTKRHNTYLERLLQRLLDCKNPSTHWLPPTKRIRKIHQFQFSFFSKKRRNCKARRRRWRTLVQEASELLDGGVAGGGPHCRRRAIRGESHRGEDLAGSAWILGEERGEGESEIVSSDSWVVPSSWSLSSAHLGSFGCKALVPYIYWIFLKKN